jgi:predicted O-methyltransferase YrrM
MDLDGFADLWEHVRLLSDQRRNDALVQLLHRHAHGARVLEVGCGSGVLSCLAARLGAREVLAVEPTLQAERARALVEANDLGGVVEVVTSTIEELEPRPFDLVFSELLNAEPFAEGVLQAMDAAALWVADGGRLAPRRLKVWLALTRENSSAVEVRGLRKTLDRLGTQHQLDLSPLLDGLDDLEPYKFVAPQVATVTAPVCIADLALGAGQRPAEHQRVALPVEEPGPVGGAVVWFEAEIDDGLVMHNAPGSPGHWGHLVLGWAHEVGGRSGGHVSVDVDIDLEDGVTVRPA